MAGVRNHKDLAAWRFSWQLKEEVFAFTANDRVRRDFKFCDQIRSASNSATDNISEGFYRYSPTDFARFLTIARASLGEVKNQLEHARSRDFLDESEFRELWTLACRAMAATTNLMKYLRRYARRHRTRNQRHPHAGRTGTEP
jgi:four helix bundle protein